MSGDAHLASGSDTPPQSTSSTASSRSSSVSMFSSHSLASPPSPPEHIPFSTPPHSRPSSTPSKPGSASDVRDGPLDGVTWSGVDPAPHTHDEGHDKRVRQRRREERTKQRRMLERRTVIDVKAIRERLAAPEEALSTERRREEERKERETKAEDLMRTVLRREHDSRNQRSARRAEQRTARRDNEEAQPRRSQVALRLEESKEQIVAVQPLTVDPPTDTFITATHDLQSLHTSSNAASTASTPAAVEEAKEAISAGLAEAVAEVQGEVEDEGMSAYRAFIHARVRHLLISNGVFIAVDDVFLVHTPYNAALAAQYPPSGAEEAPLAQFHLPSLQPASASFLPSSASISLASGDERSLYSLLLFLSRIPLLASLPLASFFRLSRAVKEVRFDEFEVIANEGEHGDGLFFVKDGRIDTKLTLERNAADGDGGGAGPLRRRFHSVNLASLDVACLSMHDVCGESVLHPPHVHRTSLISMTPSVCYAVPLAALRAALSPATLTSLALYARHSLALTRTYAAVRERYRSSYHTSVVDFRLFVEGSLRRNLRHKNERGRMRKEIEDGGGEGAGGWGKDRDAGRQIAHAQRMEKAGIAAAGRRGRKADSSDRAVDDGSPARRMSAAQSVSSRTLRSASLPPVFLSFTTLNLSDTASSRASSTPSSAGSRLPLLTPRTIGERAHPALR